MKISILFGAPAQFDLRLRQLPRPAPQPAPRSAPAVEAEAAPNLLSVFPAARPAPDLELTCQFAEP